MTKPVVAFIAVQTAPPVAHGSRGRHRFEGGQRHRIDKIAALTRRVKVASTRNKFPT